MTVNVPVVDNYDKVVQKIANDVQVEYTDLEEVGSYIGERFQLLAAAKGPEVARTIIMAGLTRGSLQYAKLII